ncbi:MAG TPA: hypothetical protein VFX89_23105 [Gammaproteobacteria bacterium]|nr:hypothetical protein [Gammaproteobacteria bacterium]
MKPRSLILGLTASIALLAAASVAAQQPPQQLTPQQEAQRAEIRAQQQELQRAQAIALAQAQQGPQPPPFYVAPGFPSPEPLPTVPLAQLLERVARSSNKQFIVDPRVPQQVFLGGVRAEDVNYPILLAVLRNHGVAATTIEGRVNLVPDANVRSLPVPFVNNDDAKIADEEFVQRVITTSTVETPMLVPILRPLLPQSAHLAAMPPNKLVVLDRYSNVKRIGEIVKALDR